MTDNNSQTHAQPPAPGATQRQLDVFVGKWNGEGVNKEGSTVPGAKMITSESYEWLPNGFVLLHTGEMRNGDEEPLLISEIMGYDAASKQYTLHNLDSQGNSRSYQAHVSDRTWTLTGEWERATIVFSDDGSTMTAHWELSKDGSNWMPLCEVTATKAS